MSRPAILAALLIATGFLLRPGPAGAQVNNDLGNCRAGKDPDERIRNCTRAIESRQLSIPDLAIALLSRGNAHDQKGERDLAIRDYDQSIPLNPDDPTAFYFRAVDNIAKRKFDLAIQDLDEAIRLNPGYADAFWKRGVAYRESGHGDRAIQDFTQAILLNPQDLRTLSSRANLYCQIGDFRRAILDYSQVFQIMPADTSAISRRGYAYLNVGDYDRAIADFDECLYRDPYDNYSIEYRGIAYLNKGDYQHAAMDLDLAVQSNFQNTYFLHNRAVMHFVQGQFDPTAPNLIGRNIGLYADAAWLYIGKMRAGQNADGLLANAEKVNINSWPGPIILMLAGKMDRTALLQAASDRYIFKERDQRCDAYFFLAEHELLTNSTREAVEDFEAAIGTCLRSRVTYAAAKSELQRLGH